MENDNKAVKAEIDRFVLGVDIPVWVNDFVGNCDAVAKEVSDEKIIAEAYPTPEKCTGCLLSLTENACSASMAKN